MVGFDIVMVICEVSCHRRLDMLGGVSAVSLGLAVMFSAVSIALGIYAATQHGLSGISWWPEWSRPTSVLATLPIVTTSYVCAFNLHPLVSLPASPVLPTLSHHAALSSAVSPVYNPATCPQSNCPASRCYYRYSNVPAQWQMSLGIFVVVNLTCLSRVLRTGVDCGLLPRSTQIWDMSWMHSCLGMLPRMIPPQ